MSLFLRADRPLHCAPAFIISCLRSLTTRHSRARVMSDFVRATCFVGCSNVLLRLVLRPDLSAVKGLRLMRV